jgi:putative MATE family efflux protein
MAFGFGFMVAGTALVARYKGGGESEKIREVSGQFVLILILFSILFVSIAVFFIEPIITFMKVPPDIFTDAVNYIRIVMLGMVFMFVFMTYQSFSHGLGDTVTPMIISLVSVSSNIVLDPIVIFGWGPFPKMGIIGAAWATVFARIVGAALALYFLKKKAGVLIPRLQDMRPRFKILSTILNISIPASISQSITSFGFLFLQGFVNTFGTVVITVFSLGNRLTNFFMMPSFGLSSALSSIVGQNLGAGNIKRAEKSVLHAIGFVLIFMLTGFVALYFFGGRIISIFINDPVVVFHGSRMFRVTSIASMFFSIIFVFNGVFNGAGYTKPTMILNISRLWVLRIPLTYMLSGKIAEYIPWLYAVMPNVFDKMAGFVKPYSFDSLFWAMVVSNIIISLIALFIYLGGGWKRVKL